MRRFRSDLEWRTGFGWNVVLLFAGACVAAAAATGAMRALALVGAILVAAYAAHRYRTWNGRAWRQVHFRAMRAYDEIVGRGRPQAGDSRVDERQPCVQLGLLLCGDRHREAVGAIVADAERSGGARLAGLVEQYAREVLPPGRLDLQREITAALRQAGFGPELIIAAVVENVYGGREAARYAVALATGEAPGRRPG